MNKELRTIHKLAQEVLATMPAEDPNNAKLNTILALTEDILDHFIDDGR